jgi:putative transposase
VSDCGWREFVRQLEYKSLWSGGELKKVPRFFASSKTCSHCGFKNTNLTLSDREWVCSQCGVVLDRDVNAAVNMRDFNFDSVGNRVGHTRINARGDSVSKRSRRIENPELLVLGKN